MKSFPALLICLLTPALLDAAPYPENCNSKEDAIRIAKDAVAEREEWPNGGDYNVSIDDSGWRVTAWRVDFPKHEGSARYAGGGFRVIQIGPDGALKKYSRQ